MIAQAQAIGFVRFLGAIPWGHFQWGNAAEWVAGIGTVAAFWATRQIIRADHDARQEERATSAYNEALKVVATVGPAPRTVPVSPDSSDTMTENFPKLTVTNNSSRPIFKVTADCVTGSGVKLGYFNADEIPPAIFMMYDCDTHEDMWAKGSPPGRLDVVATVRFEDSGRTRWLRDSHGNIKRDPMEGVVPHPSVTTGRTTEAAPELEE